MSKVKMLLDVVNEVKKEAPEDVPNWNAKLAEAKVNLQNQIAKGRLLPKGVEDHPLEHFAFNYSVQRDVRAGHVMNIMKKFGLTEQGSRGNAVPLFCVSVLERHPCLTRCFDWHPQHHLLICAALSNHQSLLQ